MPLLVFYACVGYLSCIFPVAYALVALLVPAQYCRGGKFFPKSAVFALVLGISVRGWGIFALALEFLGCASGVAL